MKKHFKFIIIPIIIILLIIIIPKESAIEISSVEPSIATISPINFREITDTIEKTTEETTKNEETSSQDTIASNTIVNPPVTTPQTDLSPKFPPIDTNANWRSPLRILERPLPLINSEERLYNPTHILLHFMSNAGNNPTNPYIMDDMYSIFMNYELSVHYVIDRNGDIYMFTPENRVAYHAGPGTLPNYPDYTNKLNHHSIGIELLGIGTKSEMLTMISEDSYNLIPPSLYGFTDEQYSSLNTLINDLTSRHSLIKRDRNHILGHSEYNTQKSDPGVLFQWNRIGL